MHGLLWHKEQLCTVLAELPGEEQGDTKGGASRANLRPPLPKEI